MPLLHAVANTVACHNRGVILEGVENEALFRIARDMNVRAVRDGSTGVWELMNYPRLLSCMDNPFHRLVSSQHLCSLSEEIYLSAVPGYLSYTEIRQE